MASKNDSYYFDSFVSQVKFSGILVEKLQNTFKNFDTTDLHMAMDEVHLIEHTADIKHHEIMEHLSKEFVPPIEREDIVMLTQMLDDLTDSLEDILILVYTYNVARIEDTLNRFLDLIEKSVSELKNLLDNFCNYKRDDTLNNWIIEINRLEENGDLLYHDALHRLFMEDHDARYLISQKEIYEKLENVLDTAEDISNEVANIIMKNS
ncbi:MAG: DUF47 domain-containing protein [Flexilinea sp.]|jgi:hypothetical protein